MSGFHGRFGRERTLVRFTEVSRFASELAERIGPQWKCCSNQRLIRCDLNDLCVRLDEVTHCSNRLPQLLVVESSVAIVFWMVNLMPYVFG